MTVVVRLKGCCNDVKNVLKWGQKGRCNEI